MSIEVPGSVDEFIQGEKEPASSGVVVVLGFVSMLSFLILYGILFPGRDMPVISEVLPMFEGVFDSGIWFFLLGVIFGAFSIIATMLTEATSEGGDCYGCHNFNSSNFLVIASTFLRPD